MNAALLKPIRLGGLVNIVKEGQIQNDEQAWTLISLICYHVGMTTKDFFSLQCSPSERISSTKQPPFGWNEILDFSKSDCYVPNSHQIIPWLWTNKWRNNLPSSRRKEKETKKQYRSFGLRCFLFLFFRALYEGVPCSLSTVTRCHDFDSGSADTKNPFEVRRQEVKLSSTRLIKRANYWARESGRNRVDGWRQGNQLNEFRIDEENSFRSTGSLRRVGQNVEEEALPKRKKSLCEIYIYIPCCCCWYLLDDGAPSFILSAVWTSSSSWGFFCSSSRKTFCTRERKGIR